MLGAKRILALTVFIGGLASASATQALEAYSSEQQTQFMNWCTGAQTTTETVCSCTLKSLAQTMPAAALANFLNAKASNTGFSLSTSAITATAMVTQALTSCSK